jgi:hypothetical protein
MKIVKVYNRARERGPKWKPITASKRSKGDWGVR